MSVALTESLASLADEIRAELAAADVSYQDALSHAIAAGRGLVAAKKQCAHGEWLPFLAQLGVPARTAQQYMRLSRNAQDVAHLGTVSEAVALLAAPTDPEPEPERMTVAELRGLIARMDRLVAEGEAEMEPQQGPVSVGEAQRRSDRITECLSLGRTVLRAGYEAGVHTALGLTWAAWVDRTFPPDDLPAWLYVMRRDWMLAVAA